MIPAALNNSCGPQLGATQNGDLLAPAFRVGFAALDHLDEITPILTAAVIASRDPVTGEEVVVWMREVMACPRTGVLGREGRRQCRGAGAEGGLEAWTEFVAS